MRSTPPWAREALADAGAMAEAFRLGLRGALAAWPALLGRVAFYGVCLMVLGAFWARVGAARLPGTAAMRLPPGGLTPYVGVTEWIVIGVAAAHFRFEDDVRTGAVEASLLRPRSWLGLLLAEQAGASAARMGALAVAGLALLALTGRWPAPAALIQVGCLGAGGAVLTLLVYALVGLTAFWMRRVLPAMLIAQKLMFLLGGLFAPVTLYGGWLRTLALASPFAAELYAPAHALLAPSWREFVRALALQGVWIAGLAMAAGLLCRAGLARTLREGAA